VELLEPVEQTTSVDIDVDLSAKLIEGCCLLRGVSPICIVEFVPFLPGFDSLRSTGEVINDMFVDLVPYLDWESEEAARLGNYGLSPRKRL
jgi:hypothetical protein